LRLVFQNRRLALQLLRKRISERPFGRARPPKSEQPEEYQFALTQRRCVLGEETKERWKVLCERVVNEQDPEKFVTTIEELIQELESLESKEEKFKRAAAPHAPRPQ
jgi:hypothetical protein